VPPEVRDGVPTDKIGSAISVGNNLLENKTNLSLYNKLAADPTKDPISGEPMSDAAFMKYRAELSESDLKHFADERAKKNGNLPGANGPGDLNSGAIKNTLDNYLNQLQIDPSPESNGGADAARVGALRKFVDEYFYASQREAGKKFTDAEVNAHLSALFAKNTTVKGFLTTSYSGPIMGMTADDLPLATRKEIKTKLKQAGIGEPTDAQIIDQYWHTQVTR
jgi:soluble lytic murein transglycosylase